MKRIDHNLLATELVGTNEQDERSDSIVCKSWRSTLYIVQNDGRIHRFEPHNGATISQAFHTNDWTGERSYSYEEEDEYLTEPIAIYFEQVTGVQHAIICAEHRIDRKLEHMSITVYKLPVGFDLAVAQREVIDVWRQDGREGLEQF